MYWMRAQSPKPVPYDGEDVWRPEYLGWFPPDDDDEAPPEVSGA